MKILIVSYYYPPLSSIASLRSYSWAKYWARAGHEVTVLTSRDGFHDETPLTLPDLDVPVWYVSYPNPLRPLLPVLRTTRPSQHVLVRDQARPAIQYMEPRGLKGMLMAFRNRTGAFTTWRMPGHTDFWIPFAIRRAARSRQQWDVVISSYPPYGCHLVAWRLLGLGLAKAWVVDFRDQWTQSPPYDGLAVFRWVERGLERAILRKADAVTAVSRGVAETILAPPDSAIRVVENGFDPDDLDDLDAAPVFPDDGRRRIVYTGTLYPTIQDPRPLLAAVRRLADELGGEGMDRLRLVFAGVARHLPRLAREHGVSDHVDYVGKVTRDVALRMQRDADGLLFFRSAGRGVLTGKLFEYLFASAPILHIGNAENDGAAALIEQCGAGRLCGSESSRIAEAVRELVDGRLVTQRRPDEIARFTRQSKAAELLTVVERAAVGRC